MLCSCGGQEMFCRAIRWRLVGHRQTPQILCTDSQPSQQLHVRFQLAPANLLMISPGFARTESPHLSWRMNWLVEVWNLAWIYAFGELVFLTQASFQTRGCTLTKTPDLPLVPFSSHVVPTSFDSFSLNAANLMQR